MREIFKRYSLALFFLFGISLLMVLGTIGVNYFANSMIEDSDAILKARGETIIR